VPQGFGHTPHLSSIYLHFAKLRFAAVFIAPNFKLFVDDAEVKTFTSNKNSKAAIKFSEMYEKK
jgi:hypothetical protein